MHLLEARNLGNLPRNRKWKLGGTFSPLSFEALLTSKSVAQASQQSHPGTPSVAVINESFITVHGDYSEPRVISFSAKNVIFLK